MSKVLGCLAFVCLVMFFAVPGIYGQDPKETILKETESRLRATGGIKSKTVAGVINNH